MNPEPPAELAPVRPILHRQPNKLAPLVHLRHLAPRHGGLPESRFHAMMMCRSCPRTPVGDVSGLYNKPGHDEHLSRARGSEIVPCYALLERDQIRAAQRRGPVLQRLVAGIRAVLVQDL